MGNPAVDMYPKDEVCGTPVALPSNVYLFLRDGNGFNEALQSLESHRNRGVSPARVICESLARQMHTTLLSDLADHKRSGSKRFTLASLNRDLKVFKRAMDLMESYRPSSIRDVMLASELRNTIISYVREVQKEERPLSLVSLKETARTECLEQMQNLIMKVDRFSTYHERSIVSAIVKPIREQVMAARKITLAREAPEAPGVTSLPKPRRFRDALRRAKNWVKAQVAPRPRAQVLKPVRVRS